METSGAYVYVYDSYIRRNIINLNVERNLSLMNHWQGDTAVEAEIMEIENGNISTRVYANVLG